MLVFCEDCGEKNIIDPDRIKAENNQYRCSSCSFLNTCQPQEEKKSLKSTEKKKKKRSANKKVSCASKRKPVKRRKLNTHEDPYEKVFTKIEAEEGILGSYVYHVSDGLIAYDIDEAISEQTMLQIGKAFSVCSPFGHKFLKKTKEMYLVLDDQIAVCRNITTNSLLVLFCQHYPVQPRAASVINQSVDSLQAFI